MLLVWLAWAVCGALIGVIAAAARLGPRAWYGPGRLALLGAGSALAGGWLGTPLWGSIFATFAALWVAVLGVALLPRLWAWGAGRRAGTAARHEHAS